MSATAALVVVIACLTPNALQTAEANGDTRTLRFVHTHTAETLTVTFKRDGRFVPEAMRQVNHFLRDWRRNEQIEMDPRLVDLVWEVYRDVGGTEPIHLVSAYRSPGTNEMLRARSRGVARESQHTRGRAMDFRIPGVSTQRIRERAMLRQRGGVGFYAGENGFVHVDVGSVRAWPRMSRDQLARLFPNGETLHIPADGRPLPGYEIAVARLGRGRGDQPVLAFADPAARGGEERNPTRAGAGDPPPVAGRSILSTLFGRRDADEDEAETEAAPRPSRRPVSPPPATTASVPPRQQVAAVGGQPVEPPAEVRRQPPAVVTAPVPIPLPRPRDIPAQEVVAAPAPGMVLASAGTQVVDIPRPLPRPADASLAGPAIAAGARIELVGVDFSFLALRPFFAQRRERERLAFVAPEIWLSGPLIERLDAPPTRFGDFRTRRTDTFAGPMQRRTVASLD